MYDCDGKTKEGKLRLFVAKHFDLIDDLAALMRADRIGTGKYKDEDVWSVSDTISHPACFAFVIT